MDKKLAFQILGIAETKEEDKIRQTYLSLLKETNPEDDPEGFKRLRRLTRRLCGLPQSVETRNRSRSLRMRWRSG